MAKITPNMLKKSGIFLFFDPKIPNATPFGGRSLTERCRSQLYPFPAKEKKMRRGNDWGARVPILFKLNIFGLYRPTVADGINLTGFLPLSKMFGQKIRKTQKFWG
jgi:hypothetical protein